MADPAGDVTFDRALEILELSADQLEQLLVDGVLRGFRRGGDVVFHRQDLANYITRGSAPEPSPAAPAPAPPPAPSPSPARRRRRSGDSIKRAAMSGASPDGEMWSMKKYAVEQGLVEESQIPSPGPAAGAPAVPAGAPEPPAEAGAPEGLQAENEILRERLRAAEEVLQDLQSRCENFSGLAGENQALKGDIGTLRALQVELEAKLAAYEEMETGAEGPRWGAPEPEQEVIALKRESAELRGEMAALKHRADEHEKDADKLRTERDELKAKLSAASAASAGGADESERVSELQAELEALEQERDMLAVEAEVAHELKGEIERAAELEEKLQTQREVIEAAQKGLGELEGEKNELSAKAKELEAKLAESESASGKAKEAVERAAESEKKVAETEQRVGQLEARMSSLREERDGLTKEIEHRDEDIARLHTEAERAKSDAGELDRVRDELNAAKSHAAALEGEVAGLKVQNSLKDQLVEQFRAEEHDQVEITSENLRMRERVAELEGRAKQAEARSVALRAERDGLTSEFAKRDGAMDELRTQAERASSLLGENRALREELGSAREMLAEIESELAALRADRERLAGDLEERAMQVEELQRDLTGRERDLASMREQVEPTPASAESERVRSELESLRRTIAEQMDELGHTRDRAAKRKRTAREVAGKKRVPQARRAVAAGAKLDRLGRYELVDEIRRGRTGALYKGEVQPTGGEVAVLVLSNELVRDRHFVDRFWREMRVIAEFDEPKLLGVMDVGEAAGVHYIAYEYVEGETLYEILGREGSLPAPRAVDIAASLLEALRTVAGQKLVHGDVKPANVILLSEGRVKLAGLGLWRGDEADASSLGEGGRIVHYGAPEQITGGERTPKSDIWSVGAVLYQMVSGIPPIEAASPGEAKALVEAGELPRPDELDDVPENLRKSLGRLLAAEPDGRYRSAVEASKALRKLKIE
ncbi:MAG: protein kinase domain-containing protein [Planctomycetota bacterium]|jgi:chromosome segregation ATPase